jgi:hypothetical protein
MTDARLLNRRKQAMGPAYRLGDHMWGFEDSGVIPDIVTMGKPIGDVRGKGLRNNGVLLDKLSQALDSI